MDPVTAIANLLSEITKLVTVITASQPPDVQAQLWRDFAADLKAWREFWSQFHLELPKDIP